MKNCELFTTEKKLHEKWRLFCSAPHKGEITFTQWACFKDADLALQDKFMKPRLFKHVTSFHNDYALVLGPRLDKWHDKSLVYVDYIDANGSRSFDHVDNFKECDIPTEIINIAKTMVVEEMKCKCPLMGGKENA